MVKSYAWQKSYFTDIRMHGLDALEEMGIVEKDFAKDRTVLTKRGRKRYGVSAEDAKF